MGSRILERYERTADGKVVLVLALDEVDAVYNPFALRDPRQVRNLHPKLADYVVECVRELGTEPFALMLWLPEQVSDAAQQEVRSSIHDYFDYLQHLGLQKWRRQVWRSAALLLFGVSLLVLLTSYANFGWSGTSFLLDLSAQGLTVAAWLAVWEASAAWLLRRVTLGEDWRVFKRLALADVRFRHDRPAGVLPVLATISRPTGS